MDFEFRIPGNGIVFGSGKLSLVGEKAKKFGRNCLIACDPFCSKNGLAEKVQKLLEDQKVASLVYDKVIPNPTIGIIDAGASIARKEKCDFVIGLGGGSSIDTAKGIAVAAAHKGGVWQYAIGDAEITDKTLPVVAINTTSGTGSHCTCFSVISNNKTHQKPGMGSPYILPSLAIVDPELMLTVPKELTLITGFDVFSHAVEALTSKAASPVSDMLAEKAISLVVRHLPECHSNGQDIEARSGMALADTYSGIAISHAVVSLGHVMAHVISGHYPDIAHGDALYSIYREVLRFNAGALPEKHAYITKTLSPGSKDIVSAFDDFFRNFRFENRLKNKKPDVAKLEELAADTFTYMKGITELNPVEANEEDAKNILAASMK